MVSILRKPALVCGVVLEIISLGELCSIEYERLYLCVNQTIWVVGVPRIIK